MDKLHLQGLPKNRCFSLKQTLVILIPIATLHLWYFTLKTQCTIY